MTEKKNILVQLHFILIQFFLKNLISNKFPIICYNFCSFFHEKRGNGANQRGGAINARNTVIVSISVSRLDSLCTSDTSLSNINADFIRQESNEMELKTNAKKNQNKANELSFAGGRGSNVDGWGGGWAVAKILRNHYFSHCFRVILNITYLPSFEHTLILQSHIAND